MNLTPIDTRHNSLIHLSLSVYSRAFRPKYKIQTCSLDNNNIDEDPFYEPAFTVDQECILPSPQSGVSDSFGFALHRAVHVAYIVSENPPCFVAVCMDARGCVLQTYLLPEHSPVSVFILSFFLYLFFFIIINSKSWFNFVGIVEDKVYNTLKSNLIVLFLLLIYLYFLAIAII